MKDIYYESLKDARGTIFAETQHAYSSRLHFHRAFEVAYILEGEANYTVENENFTAHAGDIVFTHCYYLHAGKKAPQHTKYVVAVPEKITSDIRRLFENDTLPVLLQDKEFNKTLLPHFEALINQKEMSTTLTKGYSNIIFGSLASHYEKVPLKKKNKNVSIIENILNYIDSHYNETITLESISAHFGYNKNYFSRLFNEKIGMSLTNYINMVRYDKFEKIYKNTDKNITEIVMECGFSSLPTFYRTQKIRNELKKEN